MLMQGSESQEAEEVAYHHITKTIQDAQNLSRYHGLRAAMSMLALQARLSALPPLLVTSINAYIQQRHELESRHACVASLMGTTAPRTHDSPCFMGVKWCCLKAAGPYSFHCEVPSDAPALQTVNQSTVS